MEYQPPTSLDQPGLKAGQRPVLHRLRQGQPSQKVAQVVSQYEESGVQIFLSVDIRAEPSAARTPVPQEKFDNLSDFGQWLFGTEERRPLFTDSREVGDFSRILSSPEAVEYLRSTRNASFELALQKAGVEDEEIENQLKEASNQMELALSRVHLHLDSEPIQRAVRRLALNARELLSKYPSVTGDLGIRIGVGNDA